MKVLFYYPSNKQSNSLETLIEELHKKGLEVFLLTTCEKGAFHRSLELAGIKTFTHVVSKNLGLLYYLKQINYLAKFCREHQVSIVCSHLQHANFISVFAQYFCRSRFIIFRHHFMFNVFSNDQRLTSNRMEVLFDKVINFLAKEIVVPSSGVYNGMLRYEKVNEEKVSILPYVYNFGNYQKPEVSKVADIRNAYSCELLLLMCSRLINPKRHYLVFPVIRKLIDQGKNIKLLVLDEGPEMNNLQQYIVDNKLQDRIYLLGFRTDFINYMAACDLMIHPSLAEASNSTVKEMALLSKPVAVCSSVGDFDDYIVNNKNGFLLSADDTEKHLEDLLNRIYQDRSGLIEMGRNLHESVLKAFDRSDRIVQLYVDLFELKSTNFHKRA